MTISILVTGISGSGKTAMADELNKQGHIAYSIEDIPGLFMMINKKTKKDDDQDNYNLESCKQHDWICDKNKLKKLMHKNAKGTIFYCGVASNIDEILPLFDKVFLLKVSPKIMCERLSTRTSNDFGRTPEIQKWILSWKEWWEDRMIKEGAIPINANRTLKTVTSDIIKRSK